MQLTATRRSLTTSINVWPTSPKAARRNHGEETLVEIGKSYNVSGWTIARLEA